MIRKENITPVDNRQLLRTTYVQDSLQCELKANIAILLIKLMVKNYILHDSIFPVH